MRALLWISIAASVYSLVESVRLFFLYYRRTKKPKPWFLGGSVTGSFGTMLFLAAVLSDFDSLMGASLLGVAMVLLVISAWLQFAAKKSGRSSATGG